MNIQLMPKFIRYINRKSKITKLAEYIVGILVWHLLFIVTGTISPKHNPQCYIENFGVHEVEKGFVKNTFGVLGYRVLKSNEQSCAQDIYNVQYYFDELKYGKWEYRSIGSIVDIDSWRLVQEDYARRIYKDRENVYIIYDNSDGISISAISVEKYE
jgi:hypothetical protein